MKTIEKFLLNYKDQKIFYKPNNGNGGDALIALGAFSLFERLNITYEIINSHTDISNQIVFYAGGGNLVDYYSNTADFIRENVDKIKEFVLLPHTIKANKNVLLMLNNQSTIICREQVSYNYVNSLGLKCQCLIMDDLAFSLPVEAIRKKFQGSRLKIMLTKHNLKMFKYQGSVIQPLVSLFFGNELNAFRIDDEKTQVYRPKNNLDLSLLILYDGEMMNRNLVEQNVIDLMYVLDRYDVVNTNRLHLAIAGALLGKDVNFYPNAYYKNRAIYLYSLKNKFKNVTWVDDQNQNLQTERIV